MKTAALATLILGALTALPAAEPPPPLSPTQITWEKPDAALAAVAGHLSAKADIPVEVAPALRGAKCGLPPLKSVPFWEALQAAAEKSGARIALADGGRKVELVPRGGSREVASVSGPFRVVAQQVIGRALLDQGVTYHEVHLLVHWEPRVRVYRIDSAPQVSNVSDAAGSKVTAAGGGTQLHPLDATSEMRVRLSGLTHASGRITELAGSFTVTAAEKMLAFAFDSAGKLPAEQKQGGVSAVLKRVQKKGDTWEVEVEVTYPPKQPVFESFQGEWWLRDNRLVVRSPQGKSFVIGDYEVPTPDSPRPLRAIYRFKENAAAGLGSPTQKGYSIVYETPAPLAEVSVPFALKDIPLP